MSPKASLFLLFAAAFLSGSPSGVAWAEDAPATQLNHVEQQMTAKRAAAEEADKKAAAANADLSALREKLIEATKALQDKQEQEDDLEDKLATLEKQTASRQAKVNAAEGRLKVLTGAFVRLARVPPAIFLFHAAPIEDHIHRAILLRALLPRLRDETVAYSEELMDLEHLRRSVNEQKRLVAAARQNMEWQRANLDELVKTRQGLVQKTAAEREAIATQLNALASEAKDLRQLIEKINQRPIQIPKELPREKQGATALKSGLRLPVAGRISRDFGARDEYGLASQGITILGAPGAPVVAPREGRVVFVGPFKGYGQIVILQHNGGFHSFLAGFGRIDAEMGQSVAAGEPLGVLPEKAKETGGAELYFEWRNRGEPANPRLFAPAAHGN